MEAIAVGSHREIIELSARSLVVLLRPSQVAGGRHPLAPAVTAADHGVSRVHLRQAQNGGGQLGLTTKAVEMRIHRAKKRLSEALAEHEAAAQAPNEELAG